MACLDEGQLLDYLAGALPEHARHALEDHLGDCGECRALVAHAIRLRSDLGAPASAGALASSAAEPGEKVDRYLLLHPLGAGAMGRTFAAYDPKLDRKVCLKLLHPSEDVEEAAERLFAEAKAMARLSHPNVVALYDAGRQGDQLYVSMELVEGPTLAAWLAAAPRSAREVLERFLQAGEGLAAAHEAGLLHRDFKPENVLVDRAGRAKVGDFGLATRAGQDAQPAELRGTPFYMAPELRRGEPADARADQYAFCVALDEALRRAAPPTRWTGEARALRRAVQRGLSGEPHQRFPTQSALLAQLRKATLLGRRARLLAALPPLALGAAALLVLRAQQAQSPACAAEAQLAAVWQPARTQQRHRGFLATGAPYAEEAWVASEKALVAWVAQWKDQTREACSKGASGPEEACLREALRDFEPVLLRLETPDPQWLARGGQVTPALPEVRVCADRRALALRQLQPADPALRARVDALREKLREARVALGLAPAEGQLNGLQALAAQAAQVTYRPVQAEALRLLAQGQLEAGRYDAALETLRRTVRAARAGGHDLVEAQAWIDTTRVLGQELTRLPEADEAELSARAVLERMGELPELLLPLERAVTVTRIKQSRLEDAGAHAKQALALAHLLHGDRHPEVARSLDRLAQVERRAGAQAVARDHAKEAYALSRATLGEHHPTTLAILNNLAGFSMQAGELPLALEQMREVLAGSVARNGERHPAVARQRTNLGQVLELLGRFEEALAEHRAARAALEASLGASHPEVAVPLLNEASALLQLGRAAEAKPLIERCEQIRVGALGEADPESAEALCVHGQVLHALGELRPAAQLAERALRAFDQSLGPGNPRSAETLLLLGELALAQGRAGEAVAPLERAAKLTEQGAPLEHALVAFALARAEWARAPGDPAARARAAALAKAALAELPERPHLAARREALLRFQGQLASAR